MRSKPTSPIHTDTSTGLVGGWIVNHLLERGEDPSAIRIIDITPSKRIEHLKNNISCFLADVSDPKSVESAFSKPWPSSVSQLPLTVFHTVAYISPSDRHPDFLPNYLAVNVNGTRNVLSAAKSSGASVFIATSSGSIGLKPIRYFPLPWERYPPGTIQILGNATPDFSAPLSQFNSCYAWSKAQAEALVHVANSPSFRTGAIRPGHAIYGTGVENPNSLTWDYLRKGGSPSWLSECITHFVDAQNVSIAHLAYEDALLSGRHQGGKGYLVTDDNPPIKYGNLYSVLGQLAHPTTPAKFPWAPHIVMLLMAYPLEWYRLLNVRYMPWLPTLKGNLAFLQPATWAMCTQHIVFSHKEAQEEIGYKPAIGSLEGMVSAVLDWNEKIEKTVKTEVEEGRGGELKIQEKSIIPKAPIGH